VEQAAEVEERACVGLLRGRRMEPNLTQICRDGMLATSLYGTLSVSFDVHGLMY
jgi:hypothetical protein